MVDPNAESGTVCQIGDNWFYFGGLTAEELSPEEYIKNVPEADIVREIYEVLEDFRKSESDLSDEYQYYDAVLSEALENGYHPCQVVGIDLAKTMDIVSDMARVNPISPDDLRKAVSYND